MTVCLCDSMITLHFSVDRIFFLCYFSKHNHMVRSIKYNFFVDYIIECLKFKYLTAQNVWFLILQNYIFTILS